MAGSIEVPSKTFLAGEYLALNGGPALILASEPTFRFSWRGSEMEHSGASKECELLSLGSVKGPLSRFLSSVVSSPLNETFRFSIKDPHLGRGGFGRSGAEFLAGILYLNQIETRFETQTGIGTGAQTRYHPDKISLSEILRLYRRCGGTGSGADLVSQSLGGLTVFVEPVDKSRQLCAHWPFEDIEISIFRTGVKVSNHDGLKMPLDLDTARGIVERLIDSIENRNETGLISGIRQFREWMLAESVEAESTRKYLQYFANDSRWLAAKGCGAMGADVILGLHRPNQRQALADFAGLERVVVISSNEGLASGVKTK